MTDLIFSSDGDGTVPCWSASINDGVITIPFNYDHMQLAQEDEVIAQVIDILEGNIPENYGAPIESNEFVIIRIAAQADVSI